MAHDGFAGAARSRRGKGVVRRAAPGHTGLGLAVVGAVAVLLGCPPLSLAAPAPSGPAGTAGPLPADMLHRGPLLAVTPSTFWSLDLQTNNSSGVWTDPAVRSFLNQTPFTWFHYGQDTEQCNITANVMYANNGSVLGPCHYDLSAFASWCLGQRPRCHSVVFLPGEANNSSETAYTAAWAVRTLGFQPDYFNLGNEPSLWKHYGIPWTKWNSTDHSTPTSLDYAFDLHAAITAVRRVDAAAKFIGIESDCACGRPWFQDLIRVDGRLISAVAYHSYPSFGRVNSSLAQYLAPLFSPGNLTTTFPLVRSYIAHQCARCATLPIFEQEYNSGPGWTASSWNATYPNALFLGASVVQALRANVTQFTMFNLQSNKSTYGYSMMNTTDVIGPTGALFSGVLRHLAQGSVYGSGFNTTTGGVLSVLTQNARRATLFVVNTNLTSSVHLSVGKVFRVGANDFLGQWAPGMAGPTWGPARASSNYTIAPEGMLLLAAPSGSVYPGPPPATSSARPLVPGPGDTGSTFEIRREWAGPEAVRAVVAQIFP